MRIDDTLAEVERLDREATEGPWQWFGNTDVHSCYLATTHSGRMYVLDFARWGMGDAQPRFRWPVGANAGIMYPLAKMPAECGPRFEVEYRRDFTGINHPDAALIAYYRTAAPALAAEVRRLTAEHDHDHEAAGLANAEEVRLAAECERAQRDEHAAIIDRDGALLRLAVKQERADELADCLRDTDALVDLYLHATCNGRIETIVDACRKKWSALRAALETP